MYQTYVGDGVTEGELIKNMHEDFRGQHVAGFWRKIHGDKYMAGMPDVLAAIADVAALVEFKWEDRDKWLMMPFDAMVKENLTGLQAAELTMLSVMGNTCPLRARVLVGYPVESDLYQYEMAVGFDMADLNRYKTFSACDLGSVAVGAREFDRVNNPEGVKNCWQYDPQYFPGGVQPHGLELQLRRKGTSEPWRVAPLVLGTKRFKYFDVRTHINQADDEIFDD